MDLDKAIEARSILVKELYPLSLRGLSEIGTEGLIKEAESKIERIQRSVGELQELPDSTHGTIWGRNTSTRMCMTRLWTASDTASNSSITSSSLSPEGKTLELCLISYTNTWKSTGRTAGTSACSTRTMKHSIRRPSIMSIGCLGMLRSAWTNTGAASRLKSGTQ